jgi:hypothetical protein
MYSQVDIVESNASSLQHMYVLPQKVPSVSQYISTKPNMQQVTIK